MSKQNLSRRKFLHGVAAGSTGVALGSIPSSGAPTPSFSALEPGMPVTSISYPIAQPGSSVPAGEINIVTMSSISQAHQETIRALSPAINLKLCKSRDDFQRELPKAHVIFGGFSKDDLARAKQLKWIQWGAAGVESIMWPELINSDIVLTNMQRMFAPPISETVFALLLALTRGIDRYTMQTRERKWQPVGGLVEISGKTMGVVGLGGNGTDTAHRAYYGFGMNVLAVDPKPLPKPHFVSELRSLDWFPQMVARVDVLVSAAPLTPVSQNMFNEAVFRAMKPTAYFINIARGKLVDTPALVRALNERWIAGAGLDVAYKEPLPSDEPLWNAANVIITCHSSGHSPQTEGRLLALFTENIRRYANGLPLLNVVDKQRGY
ncbi:MAG: D-2-hydroxyacid dehydrogenase [Acidobacteria bacterium]|nr:MAG: D-2-hydroxyacid dehydrogenase [Acidobacteriota bacterium]